MPSARIVVIGTSSGGIEALRTLASGLPRRFPIPICVVMHTAPQSPGMLPEILGRAGPLEARSATNGERIRPGTIYVAPPDCHLLVEPGRLRVTKGPRENRFRPAIDPLFRSAAQVYGPAAIGVILSGNLDDGTAGLRAIKQLGGVAVVQDPADAMFPSMPSSALRRVRVDHVVRLAELPSLLVRLTEVPVDDRGAITVPEHIDVEVNIAKEQHPIDAGLARIGQPSSYACPECHGVLLQLKEAGPLRFRCHTGHAYSAESLIAAVNEAVEDALWIAIRSLEEATMLMQQAAEHLDARPGEAGARTFADRAAEARRQADAIRRLIAERAPLAATSMES